MYVYIYFWEKWPRCGTIYMFLEINDLSWPSYFLFIFTYSIWKWHALFMYSIHGTEESNVSWKHLCYMICYLKRKQIRQGNIFITFFIAKGNDHVMKPFNNFLLYYFCLEVYLFDNISLCIKFQRVDYVGERYCYYMSLLNLHVWILLINV